MTEKIDRSFDWYLAALAGNRGPMAEDDPPKAGFYRMKNADETHSAVAYWYDESAEGHPLRCHIDGRDVTPDRALSAWSFACKGLIKEDVYWHFAETHVWKDLDPADMKRKAFVTEVDIDQAFRLFRDSTDLKFLLKRLAQDAVNRGIEVPGATLEYREVIKRGAIKHAGEFK